MQVCTCQGCQSMLHLVDGSVPLLPNDLTIARVEKYPYCDSSGNLITPHKEPTVNYHCHVWCIKAVELLFVPSALQIPVDSYVFTISSYPYIGNNYLEGTFGICILAISYCTKLQEMLHYSKFCKNCTQNSTYVSSHAT